jgi:hypothetical protein
MQRAALQASLSILLRKDPSFDPYIPVGSYSGKYSDAVPDINSANSPLEKSLWPEP